MLASQWHESPQGTTLFSTMASTRVKLPSCNERNNRSAWKQLPLADPFPWLPPLINIVKMTCLSISGRVPTTHGCEIFELI